MRVFRILVVEDDLEACDQIVVFLRTAMPESLIDVANDIESAFERLKAAQRPYDLAILDFQLPQRLGEQPVIDESLCEHLTRFVPATIVSHITGFADDPKIMEHLNRAHLGSRPRGFCVDKKSPQAAMKLLQLTRETLYGADIENQIADLFPENLRTLGTERARTAGQRHAGSFSNRVADLCVEISGAWPHLAPATRIFIEGYFLVRTDTASPFVVLRGEQGAPLS